MQYRLNYALNDNLVPYNLTRFYKANENTFTKLVVLRSLSYRTDVKT